MILSYCKNRINIEKSSKRHSLSDNFVQKYNII